MDIGKKIKELRVAKGLTQEELADRSELSKGFISQLERDLTSPSIATLMDILQCLGTTVSEFFQEEPEDQIVFRDEDYFEKIDSELGGLTYRDLPHEGEEFGYVLKGSIKIHIGHKSYTAKKGESFYFTPHSEHYIEAFGTSGAVILWVSTPPNF